MQFKYFHIFWFTAIVVTACNNVLKEPKQEKIAFQGDKTVFNDGLINFQFPSFFKEDKEFHEKMEREGSDYLIYCLYEKNNKESYDLRLSKVLLNEQSDAEMVFTSEVLKAFLLQPEIDVSTIKDFGVYDHNNTRFRYITLEHGGIFTKIYYFIPPQNSEIFYSLFIDCYLEFSVKADSMLTEIAHSFVFVNGNKTQN